MVPDFLLCLGSYYWDVHVSSGAVCYLSPHIGCDLRRTATAEQRFTDQQHGFGAADLCRNVLWYDSHSPCIPNYGTGLL